MTSAPITTLVPAFKMRFLDRLLNSISWQTLKPSCVIISDDTESGDFSNILLRNSGVRAKLKQINAKVVTGPKRGYHDNVRFLLNTFKGQPTDFFHIHLDDDQLSPSFYTDHMQAHVSRYSLCCVSRRLLHYEVSNKVVDMGIPFNFEAISATTSLIHISDLISIFVRQSNVNWIGELNCCTLRRELLDTEDDFNILCGVSLEGGNDVGTLIKSSLRFPVLFLPEPKSLFSLHDNSISGRKGYFYSLSILVKVALCIALCRLGKIEIADVARSLKQTAGRWLRVYGRQPLHQWLMDCTEDLTLDYKTFETEFLDFWSSYRLLSYQRQTLANKEQLLVYLADYQPKDAISSYRATYRS